MKKRKMLSFIMIGIIMLTACGSKNSDSEVSSRSISVSEASDIGSIKETDEKTVTVSTIKEFADSLAGNTRIVLEAGEYDLSELDGYENPYLQKFSYQDYPALVIKKLTGLTIEAKEGADVQLVTQEPSAPVIDFEYCSDIVLKGLTCGHKNIRGECSGSVTAFNRCSGITIEDCSLYGCGTDGIYTTESEDITINSTKIYNCNYSVLNFCETYDVSVNNCEFYENNVVSLFCLDYSRNIVINDSKIHDNNNLVVTDDNYSDLKCNSCKFYENLCEPSPENDPKTKYNNCDIAPQKRDTNGGEEMPSEIIDHEFSYSVNVSSVSELLNSIDNDTLIICEEGEYNLSELDPKDINNPYVICDENYGGREYIISGVDNLMITSQYEENVSIVTENAYSKPLYFSDCSNIIIYGITGGHKIEEGTCSGSVIYLDRCYYVKISSCMLYGCGTYGLETDSCKGITMSETAIYDCNTGIMDLGYTEKVSINDCSFYENTGGLFTFYGSRNITFDSCNIHSNTIDNNGYMISDYGAEDIQFTNCSFSGNTYEPDPGTYSGTVTFDNCRIGSSGDYPS